MSRSQSADSPYRRDNYFGKTEADERSGGHEEIEGTDPADYIAFQLLLDVSEPLCERTLDTEPWNGGRTAEQFAWLDATRHEQATDAADELTVPLGEAAVLRTDQSRLVDGRGDQLHHEQREQPLSDPELYLPKQTEQNGRIVDYGQFPNRRRYTPDGYINWDETTTTGVPEVGFDTFMQCADNYLWDRERNGELRLTAKEEYLSLAKRLFYDQNHNSHSALSTFVRKVREQEDDANA